MYTLPNIKTHERSEYLAAQNHRAERDSEDFFDSANTDEGFSVDFKKIECVILGEHLSFASFSFDASKENEGKNGVYHFYIKDHLGNNRRVVTENNNLVQSTDYYPYGMPLTKIGEDNSNQPYKFGGKEFETDGGLNQYDFLARFYDPARGSFGQVDPLCEIDYDISPYVYCGGNPINRADPTGKINMVLLRKNKLN